MNKTRKYAKWIWQYRKAHGIEATPEYDWYLAKRFSEDDFWQDQIKRNKVNQKKLLYVWLTTIIYQYTNGEEEPWWMRWVEKVFG